VGKNVNKYVCVIDQEFKKTNFTNKSTDRQEVSGIWKKEDTIRAKLCLIILLNLIYLLKSKNSILSLTILGLSLYL